MPWNSLPRSQICSIGLPKDTGLELEVEDGGLAW
jgi:hypothetical protein